MKKQIIATLVGLLSIGVVYAADTNKEFKDVSAAIRKHSKDAPDIKEIKKTPVNGLLEVVTSGNEIFYITQDAKFIVSGELLELNTVGYNNLTKARVDNLNKFSFDQLKLSDAIVKKKGDGKNVLVTFEDPNCGYCRKLQPELDKLDNVTIYTFVIPILGQPSADISKQIMCSSDKAKAWDNYLKNKTPPTVDPKVLASCDVSALTRNIEFAKTHGISGTPAIFFPNGKKIGGYVEARSIQEVFDSK